MSGACGSEQREASEWTDVLIVLLSFIKARIVINSCDHSRGVMKNIWIVIINRHRGFCPISL